MQDITEHKLTEKALLDSEEKYRALVETSFDWIWQVDEQGVYTYASPRVQNILGYAPHEVVGKTPFDFMLPDEGVQIAKLFRECVAKREPIIRLENKNLRKDGHEVTLETSGLPIFDDEGAFKGYRGIDRDITKRKRAEESLRKSEERFRLIAETIQEVFWMADPAIEKNFYVSPAYETVWKRTRLSLYENPRSLVEIFQATFDVPDKVKVTQNKHMLLIEGPLGKVYKNLKKIPVEMSVSDSKVSIKAIN